MAYAIMRWEKLKTQQQANLATGHNYRQAEVTNADGAAPHPNKEFVNEAQRGYWELANERINEAVTRKVRGDAVRAMEVILTGSPEAFRRHENGRAEDYSSSQWAQDNLDFLKKTFGEKNVLSCTLHQDEKTPHFHAVIAPITTDGRLSAKELFNPVTMRGYQTAYAEAMKVHGMERGVEHSQAQHQDMQRMYAQQIQTGLEVGVAVVGLNSGPIAYHPITVDNPGRIQLDPTKWAQEQSQRVNEAARQQVEAANERAAAAERARQEANQRAEESLRQAQENAAAKDQVRGLQKQLHTSEELKQAGLARVETLEAKLDILAKQLAGGESAPAEFLRRGNMLLDQDAQQVQAGREQLARLGEEAAQAEKKEDYGRLAELRYGLMINQESQNKDLETKLRDFVGGVERLAQLDAEQAKQAAEKVSQAAEQEQQAMVQVEQVRLARLAEQQAQAEQARLTQAAEQRAREEQARLIAQQAAETARQETLARELAANTRERERRQVEQLVKDLLSRNPHIYGVEQFVQAAQREGVGIQHPRKGELVFQLIGSSHEFSNQELKPSGQEFGMLFRERVQANTQRRDREQTMARSNDFGIGD